MVELPVVARAINQSRTERSRGRSSSGEGANTETETKTQTAKTHSSPKEAYFVVKLGVFA